MTLGKDNIWRLPPPVGTSDWATFSRDSYCVDKTLLIMERKGSLYALHVTAGYLKVASELIRGTCKVAIPNHEIAQVFVNDIQSRT